MTGVRNRSTAPISATGLRLLMTALLAVSFLGALDHTVVSTSLATVAGELGALQHMSWVVVGYTLAKLQFRGRNLIFVLILATLMIPTEMLVIPWYIMSSARGWINTYWGIMFPGMISAFGIFLIRQFMTGVPDELLDAGRIDGLSEFGLYWRIALPQVRPAVAALAILTFLGNWNAFLWPLIVIQAPNMRTLPVGIALFSGEAGSSFHLIMASSALAVVPVLLVFALLQRQIIEGIVLTGLKS